MLARLDADEPVDTDAVARATAEAEPAEADPDVATPAEVDALIAQNDAGRTAAFGPGPSGVSDETVTLTADDLDAALRNLSVDMDLAADPDADERLAVEESADAARADRAVALNQELYGQDTVPTDDEMLTEEESAILSGIFDEPDVDAPLPDLPSTWAQIKPGTVIQHPNTYLGSPPIVFEKFEHQGWGPNAGTVTAVTEDGEVVRFRGMDGVPVAARPSPEVLRLARSMRAVPEVNADGLTVNALAPRVGTWRLRVDPDANEGFISLRGEFGVEGDLRASLNGWRGTLRFADSDVEKSPYRQPITFTDPDPQVVLDALYDAVNGPGRADLARAEAAAGRAAAPEVAPTYSSMLGGARIKITAPGYNGLPEREVQGAFRGFNHHYGGMAYVSMVPDFTQDDEPNVAGDPISIRVPWDAVPVPADPALGAEADLPDVVADSDPDYEPDVSAVTSVVRGATTFKPTGIEDFAQAGAMTKLDANLAALRLLRDLREEQRPATPEDQAVLARWAGWGGLSEVFDPSKAAFATRREELYTLLNETEIREAKRNTLNAHYTDANVVKSVWGAMTALGFDGGRVLEPGSGSGTFIGFAPEGTDMVGVELDSTTAAISQHLYPDAVIRNESFAETNVPNGAFDAAIGNVPFGRFALVDPIHNPDGESIHNHFILKSLEFVRPGGMVALLTSRYTLDSERSEAREKMAAMADLVGAVRLPNGSHQRVSGTNVIEDVLIFRKRAEGEEPQADQSWITSTKRDIDGWNLAVNGYFDQHPDHMLGTLAGVKGRFGGEVEVQGDRGVPDLPNVLLSIAEDAREKGLTAAPRRADQPLPTLLSQRSGRYNGSVAREADGSFTQASDGAVVPFDVPANQAEELGALVALRDNLTALLDAETATGEDTEEIADLRTSLNARYDAYVAAYGPLNRYKFTANGSRKRPARGGFARDPKSAVVNALETYTPPEKGTTGLGTGKKAAIFTTRAVAPRVARTKADTPADALTLSMEQHGRLDLPAIARMLDTDEADARARLGNLVFEVPPLTPDEQLAAEQAARQIAADPTSSHLGDLNIGADSLAQPGQLVPAAAYLSGNVRKKIAAARVAAEADPRYQANVEALSGVIPADLGPEDITPTLGAAWIDAQTVEDFVNDLLGIRSWDKNRGKVRHSGGGIWTVAAPKTSSAAVEQWGTPQRPLHKIVQSLLEQRPITVTEDGKQDVDATLAAQAKADEVQEEFRQWIWRDADRARRLTARYNDQFNAIALRSYDGSAREFPGMSEEWTAKVQGHVKNAVERIVNEPTALLAHVVGAGKTAEMVMGTAELKRLGLARKPAIVVPNHMLEQFTREYLEIYPSARILTAGQGMDAEQRREFVARAATGDWDAVIMTQGGFEAIPMSPKQIEAYIDRELTTMRVQLEEANAAAEAAGDSTAKRTVKRMETALISAENALRKKLTKIKDTGVNFEQTGIDYLMVDEAHMYSNLRTVSSIQGAAATGSNKATDLHMKMEYLRATSKSGRVATFATGTPIRNTVTQAYIMQRYLRPDLLEEAGIHSFDQWAATFGEVVEEMELKPEGSGFRQTSRFAKFRNVPEFLRMFHTFADVKTADDLNLPRPKLAGGRAQIVSVPRTEAQAAYIADLGDRADAVRKGTVDPSEDNMLKISTDGRKAALSMALVGGDHEAGKIEAAADRIAGIYERTKDNIYADPKSGEQDELPGALQIVFMDLGTPAGARLTKAEREEAGETGASVDDDSSGAAFNGYDTLRDGLVERGVPIEKIRYIHEAKNDAEKAEMFAAARDGRIAVLFGSSEKMGVGTNMQRRAKALHHLDAPWRPADVEQRDGRIERQGNLHLNMGEDVDIIRYVTEGSFDAYMWQTLERKAKFINQVMKGSLDVREIEDVGDTAMSYAEVKAIALGKPDYLQKAQADTQVTKLTRLARTHTQTQRNLESEVTRLTNQADILEANAVVLSQGVERTVMPETFSMSVEGSTYGASMGSSGRTEAGVALREAVQRVIGATTWGQGPETAVGTYAGHTIIAQARPGLTGGKVVDLSLAGMPWRFGTFSTADLKEGSGLGLVTRVENAVTGLAKRRDSAVSDAATNRVEVGRIQDRLGRAFDREADLVAWTARAERLAAKILRDDARENGAEVEYDARIDSDEFDAPVTKGSQEMVPPPEQQPVSMEVDASRLAEGNRVEFVEAEVSGTTAVGTVVGIRTVGKFVFLTIEADGKTYTRAYETDTPVLRLGDTTSVVGTKGLPPVTRVLTMRADGTIVVEVKRGLFGARGRSKFQEAEHPRDSKGRFIEKGGIVKVLGGGLAKVLNVEKGGRIRVKRETDGKEVVVDAGYLTVVAKPDGQKVEPPAREAALGAGAGAARTTAPEAPMTRGNLPGKTAETSDLAVGKKIEMMNREVTIAEVSDTESGNKKVVGYSGENRYVHEYAQTSDGGWKLLGNNPANPDPKSDLIKVVQDTSPGSDAVAVFNDPKTGREAWLVSENGEMVGYYKNGGKGGTLRFADAEDWADIVDKSDDFAPADAPTGAPGTPPAAVAEGDRIDPFGGAEFVNPPDDAETPGTGAAAVADGPVVGQADPGETASTDTVPAPDATPDDATASFTGDDGTRAWLVMDDDGNPHGFMQRPGEDPVEYTDNDGWAADVDAAGMAPDDGNPAIEEPQTDDIDPAVDPLTPAAPAGAPAAAPDAAPVAPDAAAPGDLSPAEYQAQSLAKMRKLQATIDAIDVDRAKPTTIQTGGTIAPKLVADLRELPGSGTLHLVEGDDGTVAFTPERAELHRKIVAHLLDRWAASDNPKFNIMGGGPAAGKSTMEKAMPEIADQLALINPDEIKEMLPEYADMVESGDDNAASFVHEESSYLAKAVQAEAFARRVSVALDGTGDSNAEKMKAKIAEARALGYEVNGYYVTASTNVAVSRANARAAKTGRAVPESTIRGTHRTVSAIFEQIAGDFDNVTLMDTENSAPDGSPSVIAAKRGDQPLQIVNERNYTKFKNKATEPDTEVVVASRDETISTLDSEAASLAAIDLASVKAATVSLDGPLHDKAVADLREDGGSSLLHIVEGEDGTVTFTPERAALHRKILSKMLDGFEPAEVPKFHVMGGGPAAGKSTMEAALPEISAGNVVLNADEIKAMLPEYIEAVRTTDPKGAGFVHGESSYLVKAVQAEAFARGLSVTLDGTGDSSAEKMKAKIAEARALGYEVNGYYVTASIDEAVRRGDARAAKTGRAVAEEVIRGTHVAVSSIFEDIAEEFDGLVLMDTEETGPDGGPAVIGRKAKDASFTVEDNNLFTRFLDKRSEAVDNPQPPMSIGDFTQFGSQRIDLDAGREQGGVSGIVQQ